MAARVLYCLEKRGVKMKQKLKWFKEAGVLQHIACFLLYVFTGVGAMLLWELLEDSETLFVLSSTALCVPVIVWVFYLGYCDVTRIGKWLWKRIVPERWRKKTVQPKSMTVKKPDVSKTETEIFRMWDDAVVWKDDKLQLRKNGKYTPITLEQAREQERGYHRYQASMDVNRGGAPDEIAWERRGFDQNGNYVRPYEVDGFFRKKFDIEPNPAAEPAKIKCRGCGKLVAPNEMRVRDGAVYCAACARRLKIKSVRCERCGTTLKEGQSVLRGGKSYCKYCGSLPDVNNDRMVYETEVWSIVWNDGELYVRSRESGCRRIHFLQAKTIESDHARRMMEKAVRLEGWSPEEAERAWGFENGRFAKKYAIDAFLEGMKITEIANVVYGSVVWMENGLHYLKSDGSCKPISIEEARQLEKGYWSYDADHAYRVGASAEQVQEATGFDENGNQLRPYAVDQFWTKMFGSVESAKQDKRTEIEIFCMWDDAVVWKDDQLQLRKNGEYTPLTLEQAREQERGYHRYQASMDVNRGGAPDEIAWERRGFDSDGNYVRTYEVDKFMEKKFGVDVKLPDNPEVIRCARCKAVVSPDDMTVREGSAYCAGCATRLQIKPRKSDEAKKTEVLEKVKSEVRCEHCGKLLKAGEVVFRRGVSYCRKCGDLPEKSMDETVLDTGGWSIVWNNGKLYKHTQKDGYVRINLPTAREMEREYWWGHVYIAVDRFSISQEEAESRYGFKDGKYTGSYAVDALTDGRKGTRICPLLGGEIIWKDGGLYALKVVGECTPISIEEVRQMEFDYWNSAAAYAYRAGDVNLYEEAEARIDETRRGLKQYTVDEFMARKAEAVCTRCGIKHHAPLKDLAAPDFACKTCGSPVKIKIGSEEPAKNS